MWQLRKHLSSIRRDTRGAAILEMTVILPVLLLIGLGVFEFGNLIYNYHLITVGVRDAARYAAGLPEGSADGKAKNIAVYGTTINTVAPRVSWWDETMVDVAYSYAANLANSCTDGSGNPVKCYRGGDSIVLVTVSTDVPYQALGFLGFLKLGTITLHAQHEERLFGVR